ncbi:MAG: hypothetical protein KAT34_06015 [Candidatus Aminicenantes bacterium]|nr:hypothetical protein [Candidatus Aminicenantes bacterium]
MPEESESKKQKIPVKETKGEKSPTLESQVDDLQKKLAKTREEISRKEREFEAKKRASGAINKAAELFGKAFEKLKKGIEDAGIYYKGMAAVIAEKVDGETKKEIGEIIKDVDRDIKDQEKKVKNTEDKLKESEKEYNNAEKKYKGIQEDFNSAKRLQREIENKLRKIDNAGKFIAEEEKKGNFALIYFLTDVEEREAGLGAMIKELSRLTGRLKSFAFEPEKKAGADEAVDEFKKILEKEWADLYKAEEGINLKKKKEDVEKTKAELEKNEKELVNLQQARRSNILEKLKKIKFKKEE